MPIDSKIVCHGPGFSKNVREEIEETRTSARAEEECGPDLIALWKVLRYVASVTDVAGEELRVHVLVS